MPSVRLKRGKGEYVRRQLPNGEIENVCLCTYNSDFSTRGCINQVHGSLLQEVMENNGKYAEGKIPEHRRTVGVDHRCEYCYARRHNWGQVTSSEVNEITREDFERYKPEVIRLGKNTEAAHPFYIAQLLKFLDLCREYKTSLVIPTKSLPFSQGSFNRFPYGLDDFLPQFMPDDDSLIEALKATNSVVNYSIANDSLESGPVSQGFTNRWRIKQGDYYFMEGVNVTYTLTCDVTSSIEDNARRGFAVLDVLRAKNARIPIRLLPLRPSSRKLTLKATGMSRHELTTQSMFDEGTLRYKVRRNGELVPNMMHPDFQELVDSGVGVCGQIGDYENCDKCHRGRPLPMQIQFPAEQLIEVAYSPHFYKDRKELREKRKMRGKKQEKPEHKQLGLIK